jgi:hypothetical protein
MKWPGMPFNCCRDPEMHDSFAKAGLQRARTVFSGMKIVEQYEAIYRRVING